MVPHWSYVNHTAPSDQGIIENLIRSRSNYAVGLPMIKEVIGR